MKNNDVKNSKGFTLLELLVVVLIIGILAGIALPQYQMAVGKARFATLKNITKSIQQSAQRYYMVHATYDLAAKDLDIDLNFSYGADGVSFGLEDGIQCIIWKEGQQARIACNKSIFNERVWFYVDRETGKPTECLAPGINQEAKSHKLCQKETGKNASQAYCQDTFCSYGYGY